MIHLALHFILPAIVGGLFFRQRWVKAYLCMIATMAVDIDHLLADPVYDPGRCSIGYHPLHEPWFIALYLLMCFVPKIKLFGLGLSIHMALDALDCRLTSGVWMV